jgi:hypothetical protein
MPACSTWASSSAFAFGVWLFDDPVTPMALAGMVLIVGAGLSAPAAAVQRGQGRPRPDATQSPS